MTKQNVLECFSAATAEVMVAIRDLKVEGVTFANTEGLILQLTDRLLQANEIEENARAASPILAGAAQNNIRSIN